jgi:thioredoxin-related protein
MKTTAPLLTLIILLLLTCTQCSNAQQGGIKFFEGSFKEAMQKAKETHKPVMVDMSTSWCGWCRKMKATTFTDKEAADYYNEHFISIELNAENGEGLQLAQQFSVNSYPTLIYFDPDQHLILFSEGYIEPDGLIKAGDMALTNWKKGK